MACLPEFKISYATNQDWLKGDARVNSSFPSTSVVIRPRFAEAVIIPLTILIDLGSRVPDYTEELEVKEPLFFKVREQVESTCTHPPFSLQQMSLTPPRLRRQIAKCVMEPLFLLREESEAKSRNYLDSVSEALKNLTMFLRTCYSAGVHINLTLIFMKQKDDKIYRWTPMENQVLHPRGDTDYLTSFMQSMLFYEKGEVVEAKSTTILASEIARETKDSTMVISQSSSPKGYTGKWWYHHHYLFPLSTLQMSKDLRSLLPKVKNVMIVLRIITPYSFTMKASSPFVLTETSKNRHAIILKKDVMYPTDCVYLSMTHVCVSNWYLLRKMFAMSTSVIVDGKLRHQDEVVPSQIRRDIWLDTMVNYYVENCEEVKNLRFQDTRHKAYTASILHCSIGGTDLSLIGSGKRNRMGIDTALIWNILNVKGFVRNALADTARKMAYVHH